MVGELLAADELPGDLVLVEDALLGLERALHARFEYFARIASTGTSSIRLRGADRSVAGPSRPSRTARSPCRGRPSGRPRLATASRGSSAAPAFARRAATGYRACRTAHAHSWGDAQSWPAGPRGACPPAGRWSRSRSRHAPPRTAPRRPGLRGRPPRRARRGRESDVDSSEPPTSARAGAAARAPDPGSAACTSRDESAGREPSRNRRRAAGRRSGARSADRTRRSSAGCPA